ncbi:methionyl-tRNA formyltransferase [Corynebacterium kroppenstedtii]|uniref:methionyl-tRNA formyltransferase n=1 Tax=Corynebacterium kroppenstedtii TaxID=161879 RepID=UPI00387357AF
MRVVFAGTPTPAATALQALLDSHHDVVAVLTRPDAPRGRGRRLYPSPVSELAEAHDVPVIKTSTLKDESVIDSLAEYKPDCIPVVAYGALVPPNVLTLPRWGWVNLHFSLLPRWRGAAPVQRAIEAGDKETGVTVFRIEEGLDTGDIFASVPADIADDDTAGSLMERLTDQGAQVLVDTLDSIENGSATPTPQSDDGATYAKKISTEDTRIDWNKPASTVDQSIRAVTPDPGAWTLLEDDRIRVGAVQPIFDPRDPIEKSLALSPGEIAWKKNRAWVGTADYPVQLGSVQAPGKKMMEAGAWVRGAHLANGLNNDKSAQNNPAERDESYDDIPHEGTRFQ